MLPAEAYTSPEVLAWEQRHLFAGSWTCLGRVDDLFPLDAARPVTQRALVVGDVACLLVRDGTTLRMFANTCRHRGHELLPEGDDVAAPQHLCPYHAWTYDLGGPADRRPRASATTSASSSPSTAWSSCRCGSGRAGSSGTPCTRWAAPRCRRSTEHLGDLAGIVAPYAPGALVLADRHTYEVAANWKVIAENYHECYHCPLIHPELCQVSPPTSGDNYDLPGAWVGGSMDLRDGMATMSLTGELAATPLPGVDPTRVEYLHLLPNLLVSAHPDYVMTHRMVPLAPDRTWVECSWLVVPDADGVGARRRPVPWSSGTSPTSRTGRRASRCSADSPARTSSRARSRPTRTPSRSWWPTIGRAYRTGRLATRSQRRGAAGVRASRPRWVSPDPRSEPGDRSARSSVRWETAEPRGRGRGVRPLAVSVAGARRSPLGRRRRSRRTSIRVRLDAARRRRASVEPVGAVGGGVLGEGTTVDDHVAGVLLGGACRRAGRRTSAPCRTAQVVVRRSTSRVIGPGDVGRVLRRRVRAGREGRRRPRRAAVRSGSSSAPPCTVSVTGAGGATVFGQSAPATESRSR